MFYATEMFRYVVGSADCYIEVFEVGNRVIIESSDLNDFFI
jgi:hypothetical protein